MRRKFKLYLLLALFFGIGNTHAAITEFRDNSINSTEKADPIDEFWHWFKANEKRLRKFEQDPDKYLMELLEQAKKIQDGLAIELEPPKNAIINLTVSADGDRNLFPLVKQIISKAPKIEGWKFIVFRQPLSLTALKSLNLKVEGIELNPEEMKFYPIVDGDSIDVIIHVKGITDDNYNQVAYGGLVLLDNLLGEHDCVTKVRNYDFQELPVKKEELGELRPLLELPKYIASFHRSK